MEFFELCVEKMLFLVSFFWPCSTCSFTAVLILHTFMVIVLTVVVSETVLLAIVCNCVHCSFSCFYLPFSCCIRCE